ncbi:MAG: hypothetical protein ACI4A7_02340 [Prevotella sp.]
MIKKIASLLVLATGVTILSTLGMSCSGKGSNVNNDSIVTDTVADEGAMAALSKIQQDYNPELPLSQISSAYKVLVENKNSEQAVKDAIFARCGEIQKSMMDKEFPVVSSNAAGLEIESSVFSTSMSYDKNEAHMSITVKVPNVKEQRDVPCVLLDKDNKIIMMTDVLLTLNTINLNFNVRGDNLGTDVTTGVKFVLCTKDEIAKYKKGDIWEM